MLKAKYYYKGKSIWKLLAAPSAQYSYFQYLHRDGGLSVEKAYEIASCRAKKRYGKAKYFYKNVPVSRWFCGDRTCYGLFLYYKRKGYATSIAVQKAEKAGKRKEFPDDDTEF